MGRLMMRFLCARLKFEFLVCRQALSDPGRRLWLFTACLGRVFFSCHPCVTFANAIPTRISNQVKHKPFNTCCQYHHNTTLNWKHPVFLVKLEAEHYCRPRAFATSKLRDLPWLTNSLVTIFAHWSNSLVGCLSHSWVSWSVGSHTSLVWVVGKYTVIIYIIQMIHKWFLV